MTSIRLVLWRGGVVTALITLLHVALETANDLGVQVGLGVTVIAMLAIVLLAGAGLATAIDLYREVIADTASEADK